MAGTPTLRTDDEYGRGCGSCPKRGHLDRDYVDRREGHDHGPTRRRLLMTRPRGDSASHAAVTALAYHSSGSSALVSELPRPSGGTTFICALSRTSSGATASRPSDYDAGMTSDGTEGPGLTPDAVRNRAMWDAYSDEYQAKHAEALDKTGGLTWGSSETPESALQVLGDVAGKDILELGCGAAQWSIGLVRAGARPVGLDLSARQLEHARRLMTQAGVDFPLLHASAEAVPLPDCSFDVVFCDHGAMTSRTRT